MAKIGDIAFKAFTGTLGVVTLYLAGNFAINFYRGISWHNEQTKLKKQEAQEQET